MRWARPERGVETSLDTAGTSACATPPERRLQGKIGRPTSPNDPISHRLEGCHASLLLRHAHLRDVGEDAAQAGNIA